MNPHFLILIIISPLAGALLVSLFSFLQKERTKLQEGIIIFFLCLPLFLGLLVASSIFTGTTLSYNLGGWDSSLGIVLYADGLSILLSLVISTIMIASYIYSLGYLKGYTGIFNFIDNRVDNVFSVCFIRGKGGPA